MKKAFTLIELLVVILIIGILTAIALPKYQKAVEKTKYNSLKIHARSLLNAVKVYHLANNTWPTALDELDIQLPGEVYWGSHVFIPNYSNKKIECYLWYDANGKSGAVGCSTGGLTYYANFQDVNTILCRVNHSANGDLYKQICFNETGDTASTRRGLDYAYP